MENLPVVVRKMEWSDLGGGLRLSTEQGWNQTEEDWGLIVGEDQNTCLLAECEGKIVGTTTAMNYSNEVAWIGMVLVDRAYRGRGISKRLLAAVLEQLSSCPSIKLDATSEGRNVYQKFEFSDEYGITRMVIPSVQGMPFPMEEASSREEPSLPYRVVVIEPAGPESIQHIITLDKIVFGTERRALVESLTAKNPGDSWVLMHGASVAGFALGRKGRNYHQIGPVVAPGLMEAKALVSKALSEYRGKPVVVDIPHDKHALIEWLTSIGFVQQRHFVRMYNRSNSFPGVTDRQYLICGPEFG